jgi:hypothetical protein
MIPQEAVDFLAERIAPAAFDPTLPPRVAEGWQQEAKRKAREWLEEVDRIRESHERRLA